MIQWTAAHQVPRPMGILQARILEWVDFLQGIFSRGSSQHRDQTQVSSIAGRLFTIWATREAHDLILFANNCALPHSQPLVLTAAIKRLALSLITHFLQITCLFSLVCVHISLFHVCQVYHVSRPGFLWFAALPGQWLVFFTSWGKFPAIISLNTAAASFHHIFCF